MASPEGNNALAGTGIHTLGTDPYHQIIPRANDTYIGGPLIEGNYINHNDNEAIFFETGYTPSAGTTPIRQNTTGEGKIFGNQSGAAGRLG